MYIETETGRERAILPPEVYIGTLGELGVKLTDAQFDYFLTPARFIVLTAGTRYGKSFVSGYKAAIKTAKEPELTGKPCRGWIVCPWYKLGEKEFRYIRECLHLMGYTKESGLLTKDIYNRHGHAYYLEFANGSTVEVYTAENMPGLLGEEVDWILFSEAGRFRYFEELWMRYCYRALNTRIGEAYFPTTPAGFNFLHDLTEYGKQSDDDPNCEACENQMECKLKGITIDSPLCDFQNLFWDWSHLGPYKSIEGGGMPEKEFKWAELTLTEEVFQEQYLGLFTLYSGRVYKEYNERYSLIDKLDFDPRHYPVSIGIDFGYENQSAAVFVCNMGDRHFIFDEIYDKHLLIDDFAQKVLNKISEYKLTNFQIYADHDAGNRAWFQRRCGLVTKKARKDIEQGIQYVKHLLLPRQNGLPALVMLQKLKNLRREFELYHWKESQKDDINKKEIPADKNNHLLDALRYCMFTPAHHLYDNRIHGTLSQDYKVMHQR